jgi:hypothetical protein
MKHLISGLLCLSVMGFLACGGGSNTCTQNIGAGHTAVYQNAQGQQVQITAGPDGNISYPYGSTVTLIQ